MVIDIILDLAGFTMKAKMIGSEKPWEEITTVVMVTRFDEGNVFVLGRTLEDYLVVVIHGKDHGLVVSEMMMKGSVFG